MARRSSEDFFSHPHSEQMRANVDAALSVADMRDPASLLMAGEPEPGSEDSEVSEEFMEMAKIVRMGGGLGLQEAAAFLQERITDMRKQTRLLTFNAILRYVWRDARNPWMAMCLNLSLTRMFAPEIVKGISASEAAIILTGTSKKRAAVSARERKVDELLKRWGVKGFIGLGGRKTNGSRKVYSEVQKGNNSRRKGERRRKGREFKTAPTTPTKTK